MRISDWSSDVCSSDLIDTAGQSGAEQNCYGEKPIERIETDEALERITSSPVRIAYILCVGEGHDEAAEHEKEINAEPAVAGIVRKDRGQVKARLRDHDRQVECQYCHGRQSAADLQRFDLHRRIMRHTG